MSDGDREKEMVLLVAHGSGSDAVNSHWRQILDSLGRQMQQNLEPPFAFVVGANLREDWPDKCWVPLAEMGKIIEEARARGGRESWPWKHG